MRIFGKTVNLFVGLTKSDVDERAREAQEERVKKERDVRMTQEEEKKKRRTGRRLVARLDVRDMTEDEFWRMFGADARVDGGADGGDGDSGAGDA